MSAPDATSLDFNRLGAIALVVALAIGAVWLDRGRHDPVPGFGIIAQPGATEIPVLASGLAVGDPAPNFRLRSTGGGIVELADLRGGPVLLHFWTTWCLECASEIPALRQLAETHAGNLHVLGIDVGEDPGRVERAADAHGARYPMLLDRDLEVSHYYGIGDYPATVVIDASGAIASIEMGPISPGELEADLDAVLGNRGAACPAWA